jgi:hypothetical protein
MQGASNYSTSMNIVIAEQNPQENTTGSAPGQKVAVGKCSEADVVELRFEWT